MSGNLQRGGIKSESVTQKISLSSCVNSDYREIIDYNFGPKIVEALINQSDWFCHSDAAGCV